MLGSVPSQLRRARADTVERHLPCLVLLRSVLPYLCSFQCLREVLNQIMRVFQSDRKSQQIVWRPSGWSSNGGAVFNKAFYSPQTASTPETVNVCCYPKSFFSSSTNLK